MDYDLWVERIFGTHYTVNKSLAVGSMSLISERLTVSLGSNVSIFVIEKLYDFCQ